MRSGPNIRLAGLKAAEGIMVGNCFHRSTGAKVLLQNSGNVIVGVIVMLAFMSGIALTAMRISSAELQIAANDSIYRRNFLTAEAGISHALKLLERPFRNANAALLETGEIARWDFVFKGPDGLAETDDDATGLEDLQGGYQTGAVWIDRGVFGDNFYSVVLWNNDESPDKGNGAGGNFKADKDGYVLMQCDASGAGGGGAAIRVLLRGDNRGLSLTGYNAQAGANGGRHSSTSDLKTISEFSLQLH